MNLRPRSLIGMVHVGALPGTPRGKRSVRDLAAAAVAEARVLVKAGFDGVMIENMHDAPYVSAPHGPEITAAMTRVGCEVRGAIGEVPLGVQVLSFGHAEALAVALACEANFVRVENFVFAHVADEGLLATAAAGELLRLRRRLGAERIALLCDLKKKHASHAITADVSLAEAARAAEFFGADGVIVTGTHTGVPTDEGDVRDARGATRLPVWVGSGATAAQLPALFEHADAVIVGTAIKRGGVWKNPVDPGRARALTKARDRTR